MADDATKTSDDPFGDEPNDQDEFGVDQKRMTFLEHLLELRTRLFIVIATLAVATILFFVLLRHQLWDWLTYPVLAACENTEGKVSYASLRNTFAPASFFMASVYYCVYAALAVTIPVTIWQLWAFVAPGLKRKERRVIGPAIVATMVLFLAGAAFAYYVIIPIMLAFFLDDALAYNVTPLWGIADIVNLEAIMMLIMGITFELPIVIVILSKIGIVSPRFLAKYRRHAVLVIFIVGALITPTGDPVTLTLVSVPLRPPGSSAPSARSGTYPMRRLTRAAPRPRPPSPRPRPPRPPAPRPTSRSPRASPAKAPPTPRRAAISPKRG